MGLRSWFTFTTTAKEAYALAEHLMDRNKHQEYVYGVHFVVKLDEPFRRNKWFAIAWSGDGSATQNEAKGHVKDTLLLDEMGIKWAGDPSSYGMLLDQDELKKLAEGE